MPIYPVVGKEVGDAPINAILGLVGLNVDQCSIKIKEDSLIAMVYLPQRHLRLVQQPLSVSTIGNPRVTGDAQQVHSHVEGNALCDGAKSGIPSRENGLHTPRGSG